MALDPAFDRTGRAFLAASRTRRDGGREVTIERHRYRAAVWAKAWHWCPGCAAMTASDTAIAGRGGRPHRGRAVPGIAHVYCPMAIWPTRSGPRRATWRGTRQARRCGSRDGTRMAGVVVERLTTSQAAPQVRSFAPGTLEPTRRSACVAQAGTVHVTSVQADAVMDIDPATGASTRLPASIATYGRPVTVAEGPGTATAWYVAVRETRPDGSTSDTLLRVTARSGAGLPIQH